MIYILFRPGQTTELPGSEFIGMTSTHGFGTASVDDGFIQLIPASANIIEISKEEAEAVLWLWEGRDYRKIKYPNIDDTNSEEDGYGTGNVKVQLTPEVEAYAISLGKKVKTQIALDKFRKDYDLFNNNKSAQEIATWPAQKEEALAYAGDNTAATPVLNILSSARGIPLAELVARVNEKTASNNVKLANLLGEQQVMVDSIKACTTLAELSLIDPDGTTTV